ncbi:hypothetical protein AXF42_Ash014758 [Apostasia shenzhenica]|uniref:Uncharacterized protein n=1 Tax=Apostasia shenzhenica TaxID=1088818 RepID=A0A2H9ZWC0_9ASPA|nr:hypothetical protein AXF42_Ash014758 [Apostasia shenzhenica]
MALEPVSLNEETKKLVEETAPKKARHPHTIRYVERKLVDKGVYRVERQPGDGLSLVGSPPKSGHGGGFTWEGPTGEVESELEPAPPAIDPGDPNYVDEEDGADGGDEKMGGGLPEKAAEGEVEVRSVGGRT